MIYVNDNRTQNSTGIYKNFVKTMNDQNVIRMVWK